MFRWMAACAVAFSSVLPVAADTNSPLTSLITGDDSRGWEAVGRLNIGDAGFCTGAMIAPDLVLTAAHCLFDKDTHVQVAASNVEFLAGWRNGRASAYRDVRRTFLHPDYEYKGREGDLRVVNDLALLELERPIQNSNITPFRTGERPRKGDHVGVVSYAHDRTERPSLEEECQVLARQSGSLILSCTVDFGSSGAPIFSMDGDIPRIVSVVSAKAEVRGRPVSLGTALEKPLAELLALRDNSEPVVVAADQPVARRIIMDKPRDANGAKFLRP